MKFLDDYKLQITAGKGGNGIISFRREYRVDRGGPDGGDGGDGGDVYFVGDFGMNTLSSLSYHKHIYGNDGHNGKRKNMNGAKGNHIYIKVPIGTLVYSNGQLLCDIIKPEPYLIAKGGKGGKGNTRFKTARNNAPRICTNGELGQKLVLKLVLKILANVGLIGKPSAGKSTLLSKISNAKPKIASYEFTTLIPQLGIVNVDTSKSFVVADLPGLIQGAALGKGLGHKFLQHIERCQIIAHVIDFGSSHKNPIKDYITINKELQSFSLKLLKKQQIIIANKKDLVINFNHNLKKFQKAFPQVDIFPISALTENNFKQLKFKLHKVFVDSAPIEYEISKEITISLDQQVIIRNPFHGMFEVEGAAVKKIYNQIPLSSWENFQIFNKKMKELGIWKKLIKKGIKESDTVRIFNYEFQWSFKEDKT